MRTIQSYSYAASEWFGSADAFQDALGFTAAELAENRRGRIPRNQARRLWRRARTRLKLPAAALLLLSAIATVLALLSWDVLKTRDVFGWLLWLGIEPPILYYPLIALIAAALATCALVEVGRGLIQLWKLRRDLNAGRAAIAEGNAHFSSELVIGPNLSAKCWLVLNNTHYEVTASAPIGLPTRGACRIYHTPGSRMVLSVESA
jgi:hypothetical protein